jgi:putative salt-induced outer membrane protein YdiY
MTTARTLTTAAALAALAAPPAVLAQVTVKPDGQWRAAFTLGASIATGNTESTLLNAQADAVRATDADKLALAAQQTYGRSTGARTSDLGSLGARYNRDVEDRWFWFTNAEATRNELANLSGRASVSTGLGRHLVKTDTATFDVFGGLGWSYDRYVDPVTVAGAVRDHYQRWEPVIGEESTHRISTTTTLRQRLALYPNATDTGEFRATFEAGIAVAMTDTLSLNATLNVRYNSDPGLGVRTTDSLFVTGIAYRID